MEFVKGKKYQYKNFVCTFIKHTNDNSIAKIQFEGYMDYAYVYANQLTETDNEKQKFINDQLNKLKQQLDNETNKKRKLIIVSKIGQIT